MSGFWPDLGRASGFRPFPGQRDRGSESGCAGNPRRRSARAADRAAARGARHGRCSAGRQPLAGEPVMSMHSIRCHALLSIAIAGLAACGGAPPSLAADAAPPSTVPTSPVGVFAVTSTLDFHVPGAAAPALQALLAATDGPDDPARFVVDRLVALLPDGSVKTIADAAAPLVAAYINARLGELAPHLGTVETLRIDRGGTGIRTITGVRFEVGNAVTVVPLASAGLTDLAAGVRVTLDATGRVAISEHEHALP